MSRQYKFTKNPESVLSCHFQFWGGGGAVNNYIGHPLCQDPNNRAGSNQPIGYSGLRQVRTSVTQEELVQAALRMRVGQKPRCGNLGEILRVQCSFGLWRCWRLVNITNFDISSNLENTQNHWICMDSRLWTRPSSRKKFWRLMSRKSCENHRKKTFLKKSQNCLWEAC